MKLSMHATLGINAICSSILVAWSAIHAADPVFLESGGLCVFEAEAIEPAEYWYERTGNYVLKGSYTTAGASSNGCFHFTGNTESSGPPKGIMEYHIRITNPGTYRLRAITMEAPIDGGAWDQANDCYIQMVGQDGIDGQLTKFVRHGGSWVWGWDADLETHGTPRFREPIYQLSVGTHVLRVAGRSKNFLIDKIVIFKEGTSPTVYKSAPLSAMETDTGTTTPDDSTGSGEATKITGPTATQLVMGQTYILTAEGTDLSWSYDANSDGLGSVAIGTGDSVSFTVPTNINSPLELDLTCTGGNGTDTRFYTLAQGATALVTRLSPAKSRHSAGALRVYRIDGRQYGGSQQTRPGNPRRTRVGGVYILRTASGALERRLAPPGE